MNRPLVVLLAAGAFLAQSAQAQDTAIYIDLGDLNPRIGDTVLIPIMITSPDDSIAGFSLELIANRSGLIEFHDDWVVQSAATLIADWDITGGTVHSPTAVTVACLADGSPPDANPPPLPPVTSSQTLIYLVGFFPCVIDPFGDYDVQVIQNGPAYFSDPAGQLILPVSVYLSVISMQPPLLGDVDRSGSFDIADAVLTVGCAFRGNCIGCAPLLSDVDCSGFIDIVDVVRQLDHIFRGGAAPVCI